MTVLSGRAPTRRSALIRASSFCISSEIRRTSTRDSASPATADSGSTPTMNPSADRGLAKLVEAGDRVAVGRLGGVVEQLEEASLDGLRHHVLPAARLLVDELPVQADDVDQQALGEAVLAHHPGGQAPALVGQLEVAVALDGEQAVALHPGHGLRDGRAALVQPLGDPGAQRHDALLVQLVDGPEIHLGGVDEVAHPTIVSHRGHPAAVAVGGQGAVGGALAQRRAMSCRDVVPPRPPPGRQPRPARGRRRGRRCCRCSSSTPRLWGPAGPARQAYLCASLRALDASLRQRHTSLSVVRGDPVRRVVLAAREVGARRCTSRPTTAPTAGVATSRSSRRSARPASSWCAPARRTPWPGPGRSTARARPTRSSRRSPGPGASTGGGRRSTPRAAGPGSSPRGRPATSPTRRTCPTGLELPEAGERAALRRWHDFLDRVERLRRRPRQARRRRAPRGCRVHLKWGEIHPRTMLADLAGRSGPGVGDLPHRARLARVLRRRPGPAPRDRARVLQARVRRDGLRRARRPQLRAWQEGRTGFPIVDAGMRQLRATGWMHNRLRMIMASFLVKDLHLEWQHGARHFMHWLVDGDLASNNHGWQWTAGSGTDASPFFRVFNPTTPGPQVRPRRRLHAPLGARAADVDACPTRTSRPPTCASAWATRRRWWTTRPSVSRPWTGTGRSRAERAAGPG